MYTRFTQPNPAPPDRILSPSSSHLALAAYSISPPSPFIFLVNLSVKASLFLLSTARSLRNGAISLTFHLGLTEKSFEKREAGSSGREETGK